MSRQQALLITPPLFPKEHPYEMDTFFGFKCSYCQGNGWIPILGERNKCERKNCSVYKGSGRLKAVVATKWMPDNKENQ